MDQKQTHWEHFFRDDSSNMLEDALPYLPPNLKKSAALYIKLHELQNIMEDFDDEDTLSACGLDQNNASLEMMLTAMRMRAPKETSKQIDQILQRMKMAKMYQSYQDFLQANPNANASPGNSSADSDMMAKLMPLFMSQSQPEKQEAANAPNSDLLNQINQILKK